MNSINGQPVVWVDDNQVFTRLADSWRNCAFLAIDTEFERRTTYFPILALVQIFDGDKIYLIDPQKVDCPDSFRDICHNPKVVKIMHSAREDLEVFYHSWGCIFQALFDTQLAHAFLTGDISKGYAPLVEILCEQLIDKQETQSDWTVRPLSGTQLDYAAKDVLYLPEFYRQLSGKLNGQVFASLFQSECDELCQRVAERADFEFDYRSAKEVWRLNSQQLKLFKQLFQWREQTGIDEDRTINHIFRDAQLVQIAVTLPVRVNDLKKIEGVHPRSVRLYANAILDFVVDFKNNTDQNDQANTNNIDNQTLARVANPRDVEGLTQLSDRLIALVKNEAAKHGIAASILASKRVVRRIAFARLTDETYPDVWNGWRGDILKPLFQPVFSEFNAS